MSVLVHAGFPETSRFVQNNTECVIALNSRRRSAETNDTNVLANRTTPEGQKSYSISVLECNPGSRSSTRPRVDEL